MLRPDFHFRERIAQVGVAQFVEANGLGIVRIDGQERDSFLLVIVHDLLQPLLVVLCGRAMIAGKHDRQDVRLFEVLERIFLSIHARQLEVGRQCAQRQRFRGMGVRSQNADGGTQQNQQRAEPFHRRSDVARRRVSGDRNPS